MAFSERAQRDITLWKEWKRNPGPETVAPLLSSIEPVVRSSISSATRGGVAGGQSRVPNVAIRGMATNMALHHLWNNYDDTKGSQINTYLTNYLRLKLHPEVNKYQNIVRIPHGKSDYIGKIKEADIELQEELGKRYVSDMDIAERVQLPVHHVEAIRKQTAQRDYLASKAEAEAAVEQTPFQRAMRQTYVELPQQDRAVFDLWVKQGKPNSEITGMLNMSRRQLTDAQQRIGDQLRENHAHMG